jgi:flagellar M-ring protein FliF
MENAAQKVKDWWEVADRTQRFVTIFGAAALVLLLILTAYVMSRPKMTPLYSGLTAQQQGDVVNALRAQGIPVEFAERGTVLVPSNRADEAGAAVAQAGATPSGGPTGMALLFDQGSFGQTSRKEQETIIAAKEGELAKTIMSWQGVASAKVHWNVGDDSPFSDEHDPGSVSVNIVESGVGLSGSAGKAIARLVQNATGVEPENITVVNSFGRMLFDGSIMTDGDYGAGQKLAAEIQEARRREADITRKLDVAFGQGNTIAMVQVELNMDTVKTEEDSFTPNDVPTSETSVTESVQGAPSSGASGPSGTVSNTAEGAARTEVGSNGPGGKYDSKTTVVDRKGDHKYTVTNKAPGEVKSMTVQILANKKAIKDLKAVEAIANNYLGAKYRQPGFAASVTAVEFDEKAMQEAEKAGKAAASGAKMQQIISLLPVLALIAVGFFVIKALGKAASKHVPTIAALPQGGAMPMPMPGAPAPAYAPAMAAKPAAPSFIQYQGMDDMAMPQGDAGQRLASALGSGSIEDALRIIEEAPEDPEIKAIQARINVPLEQIKHMAKTKPQSVAMLLKGWMMEDGR